MIPLTECKKGHTYKVDARNFLVGIFNGKTGFIGIRHKFGRMFLDVEYHWDTGAPHGTVQPIQEIDVFDPNMDFETQYEALFAYLEPIADRLAEERRKQDHEMIERFMKRKEN